MFTTYGIRLILGIKSWVKHSKLPILQFCPNSEKSTAAYDDVLNELVTTARCRLHVHDTTMQVCTDIMSDKSFPQ